MEKTLSAWTPTADEARALDGARLAFARFVHGAEEKAAVNLPANHTFPSLRQDPVVAVEQFLRRLAGAHGLEIKHMLHELGPLCRYCLVVTFIPGDKQLSIYF